MAPPNLTAATAINIVILPYSNSQNVFDAGTTFDVWYRYTAIAGQDTIGIFGFGDLVGYKPTLSMWTGPDSAPVPYLPTLQLFSEPNKPVQIPVTPGTTYYLKFTKNGDFPTSILNVSVLTGPVKTTPIGSILIPNDIEGLPLTIISSINGDNYNVLRFLQPFPAGEAGDALPTVILVADAYNDQILFYNTNLTYRGPTISSAVGFGTGIKANPVNNKFYVAGNSPATIKVYLPDGTEFFSQLVTPYGAFSGINSNNAGTIAYLGIHAIGDGIYRWDLVGNTDLGLFLAGFPGFNLGFDILTLSDDTLLISKSRSSGEFTVLHVNTLGAVIGSYLITNVNIYPAGTIPRIAYATDTTSFWAWFHLAGGISKFQNIRISDGAILRDITHLEFEVGAFEGTETPTPAARFGVPFSCPFFLSPAAIPIGSDVGAIRVIKVTNPPSSPQVFNLIAGGGLTPGAFSLSDGQQQDFSDVPVGSGYSISENPVAGWTTTYSVSNSSPINNISVAVGELVIVTVTNTSIGINPNKANSGVYKIVPGKRQDTLWNNLADRSTTDVKKPNPFIKTGYLGE